MASKSSMNDIIESKSPRYYLSVFLLSFGFAYASYYLLDWPGLAVYIFAALNSEVEVWRREVI